MDEAIATGQHGDETSTYTSSINGKTNTNKPASPQLGYLGTGNAELLVGELLDNHR